MTLSSTQNARAASHLVLVYTAPEPGPEPEPEPAIGGLTGADLLALSAWTRRSLLYGYGRTEVEPGTGPASEDRGYALVYEAGQDWASWGIARDGDALAVWHCGSGADKGRFPSMQAALSSLPIIWRGISRGRDASHSPDPRSVVVRLA